MILARIVGVDFTEAGKPENAAEKTHFLFSFYSFWINLYSFSQIELIDVLFRN